MSIKIKSGEFFVAPNVPFAKKHGYKYVGKIFAVTGTFHGSIVIASSEGAARCIFHAYYGGESIIHINIINSLP